MEITERAGRDETFLRMAMVLSERSTCFRRSVACILTDPLHHVLATGYNGVPATWDHCIDHDYCSGRNAPSGSALDGCLAIHAEQNALLQCADVNKILTAYCTSSPCFHCVKLLLNTSCRRIVFNEEYPHPEAKVLWTQSDRQVKREWIKYAW